MFRCLSKHLFLGACEVSQESWSLILRSWRSDTWKGYGLWGMTIPIIVLPWNCCCGVFVHRFCLIYAIIDMWSAFSRQENSSNCLYVSRILCCCLCRAFLLLGESWLGSLAMFLECKSKTSRLHLPLASTNATEKQDWCPTSYQDNYALTYTAVWSWWSQWGHDGSD